MNAKVLTAPDESEPPQLLGFALEQFIELFISRNARSQFGVLLAAFTIGLVWILHAKNEFPVLWMGAVLLLAALRYFLTQKWLKGIESSTALARVKALLIISGSVLAVPLSQFATFGEFERAAITIILLASVTASVTTTAGFRLLFLLFALPIVLPLTYVWFTHSIATPGSWFSLVGIGGSILLFLAYLTVIASEGHARFMEACAFRLGSLFLNVELQNALKTAKDANQAKTRFLAAASHDLRQPIHSMNALIAALSLRPLDERTKEIVNLLTSVSQMLSAQLDSLLDISKLDAGVVKPDFRAHRIDQIAISQCEAMRAVAQTKQIELTADCPEKLYGVTDSALLCRILANLLDNALKFTAAGGTVKLSGLSEGGRATLTIQDDGCGIALEEQQRIFEEFYQVNNPHRDRAQGLGLGLSIVARLCELLGIKLRLRSAAHRGTVVELSLPTTAAHSEHCSAPDSPQQLIHKNVLVVDDERIVRQSMDFFLAETGCTVYTAEGRGAALEVVKKRTLDLVLCDLRLRDDESGLEILREVKRLKPHLPVALMTGDTAPDRIREAQAAGYRLLHKPVSVADLLSVLASPENSADSGRVVSQGE